jgi:predicted Fe-Mo cluster-binding NifX family protein
MCAVENSEDVPGLLAAATVASDLAEMPVQERVDAVVAAEVGRPAIELL